MWFNAHFWTLCGQKILSEMNSVVRSSFPFQRYRTCEHVYIKINARVNTAFCSGLILLQGSWKKDMFSSSLVPQHVLLTLFLSILSEGQNSEVHNILFAKSGYSCLMFVQHGCVGVGWGQKAVSSWLKHHDHAGPTALRGCMDLPRLWVIRWDANVMGHGAGPRQMVPLMFLQEGEILEPQGNLWKIRSNIHHLLLGQCFLLIF